MCPRRDTLDGPRLLELELGDGPVCPRGDTLDSPRLLEDRIAQEIDASVAVSG